MRLPALLSTLSIIATLGVYGVEARADENGDCHVVQGRSSSWQWCENRITRLTPQERSQLVVHHPIEFGGKPESGPTSWKWRTDPAGDPGQASFNWHDLKGVDWMTPVRSQGSCGSCFVFGSLGAVESMFKYLVGNPLLDINLSEQSVISCITFGSCENGGTAEEVGMRLKSEGVPDESCYPYTQSEGSCEKLCSDWEQRRAFITDWHMSVLPWSDADIKAELVYAPVVVNMQTYSDFDGYKSGVYSRSEQATATGWHVVAVVGWDDSDNSWIVRNSWGDDWGMKGYFKMSRDSDCSVILTGVCFASHLNYFDVESKDLPGLSCVTEQQVKMAALKGNKDKRSIDISHCGANNPFTIQYLFDPKVSWLSLTADQPTLAPGDQTKINLTADSSTLSGGVHKTVLKLFGGAGVNTLNVEFAVTEPKPQPEAGPEAAGPEDASAHPTSDSSVAEAQGTDVQEEGADPIGTAASPLKEEDGCGCRAAGADTTSGGYLVLLGGVACWLGRRRRSLRS